MTSQTLKLKSNTKENYSTQDRCVPLHGILPGLKGTWQYLTELEDDTDWNKVYPFVREIQARENLVWIHDLSDAFDVDEYIYIDGCHVNGRGNQIIAKRISERLNPLEL